MVPARFFPGFNLALPTRFEHSAELATALDPDCAVGPGCIRAKPGPFRAECAWKPKRRWASATHV
jgi:hypothetical protein